ncbi:MAG: CopD family protein [Polyangiaceae bacterium]
MRALYLVSVWIHIVAATVWIGGMLFLVLVIVPWLRRGNKSNAAAFLSETGTRFRNIGWTCFGILSVTGCFNLWMRGIRFADFTRAEWLSSPFGKTVLSKLGVFTVVMVVSAVHDFVIGPRATGAIARAPGSHQALALRRRASFLGRLNVLLALVLVGIGVVLVRGLPW